MLCAKVLLIPLHENGGTSCVYHVQKHCFECVLPAQQVSYPRQEHLCSAKTNSVRGFDFDFRESECPPRGNRIYTGKVRMWTLIVVEEI